MRQLSNKVSIVPVIAKSDCLTKAEIASLKQKIMQEIRENDIRIYSLPDCDRYFKEKQCVHFFFISKSFSSIIFSDEDEDFKQQVQDLRDSIPFGMFEKMIKIDLLCTLKLVDLHV